MKIKLPKTINFLTLFLGFFCLSLNAKDLKIGLSKIDITPPPGYSFFGYGPEAKMSNGFRTRLFVRTLVVTENKKDPIILASAEIGAISALLKQRLQEKLKTHGMKNAKNLNLSATHTHHGPGHFFGASLLNIFGGSKIGYDPRLLNFLATRMFEGIKKAYDNQKKGRFLWKTLELEGFTRNRSLEAFLENKGSNIKEINSVDKRWTLIRFEHRSSQGQYQPIGGLHIFGAHGTVNPNSLALYDSDFHGAISRELEKASKGQNKEAEIHMLINAAAGDVSAKWPPQSRCKNNSCIEKALRYLKKSSQKITQKISESYTSKRFSDSSKRLQNVRLWRHRLSLSNPIVEGLCQPRFGLPALAGAEDGRTYFSRWPFKIEEGFTASQNKHTNPCQSPKFIFLNRLQSFAASQKTLPSIGDFQALQLGDLFLVSYPGEISTELGKRLENFAEEQAKRRFLPKLKETRILTLSNAYLHYFSTPEEYQAQHYEGASNIYGPNSEDFLKAQTRSLLGSHSSHSLVSSPSLITEKNFYPGPIRSFVKTEALAPKSSNQMTREIKRVRGSRTCGEKIIVRWTDLPPSAIRWHLRPLLFKVQKKIITDEGSHEWKDISSDQELDTQIRGIRSLGVRGFLWEASWNPSKRASGHYRFFFPARLGFENLITKPLKVCLGH